MERLDEVLDNPKRIRLVMGGRNTPKDELCMAATLRAVDNGQKVLYVTATEYGQKHVVYDVFPPGWSSTSVQFATLDWINHHKFLFEAADALSDFDPDLLIVHEPFIWQHWEQAYITAVLAAVMRRTNCRLLLVGTPHPPHGKRLANYRVYRLWRQADKLPELIEAWRWPSPPVYQHTFGWWYTPDMILRELHAKWSNEDE